MKFDITLYVSRWASYVSRVTSLLLIVILLVAGYLRFTGLNWDEGQWIHPDEGHMRMTLGRIRWPDSLGRYFDTDSSPLNVRNNGSQYSYGTLPLFLARGAAEWFDRACREPAAPLSKIVVTGLFSSVGRDCHPGTFTGNHSAVVGRMLSALADLGTVFLVYLIGRRLYCESVGLLASALMALTAFAIQQAHFFTVDSMACFFTTLVAYFAVRATDSGQWFDFATGGLAVGLAAGCKVSAVFSALMLPLAAVAHLTQRTKRNKHNVLRFISYVFLAALLSFVAFRVAQPYAFEGPGFFGVRPSEAWFGRLAQIRAEQSGEIDLPSGRQWTNRAPVVFPWVNIVVWGMGLPLGLAAWIGWAVVGFELFRGKCSDHLVLWSWTTILFLYQSTQWVKAMRYFLSLYPILILFAAYLLIQLVRRSSSTRCSPFSILNLAVIIRYSLFVLVVAGTLFWAWAVFSIYRRPHTRVAASRWIYKHVTEGSTVANEHWDWGLPLRIDGRDPFGEMYTGFEMEHYHEDTPEKRAQLYEWLDRADYIFLASNRLYASISRLPNRYPLTTAYYRALFAGQLGFELEADFTSYPALGPFVFPDQENPFPLMEADYDHQQRPVEVNLPPAEESFSVYDHPRVLIFRKTEAYSRQLVASVLGDIDVEKAAHGLKPTEATPLYYRPFAWLKGLLPFGESSVSQASARQFSPASPDDPIGYREAIWREQQRGGTWSGMFDRDGLLNQKPGLAAVAWWAAATVLGWLAFPLLFVALPGLRDRGYGFARLLALLLIAYLTWLTASWHALPNTRGTILRMVTFLALVGGGIAWLRRRDLRQFIRRRWRALVLMEGLFALLYAGWIGVRLLQPDLWHPVVGGEKPMDFAYLNAVMKSTWFPPYNPWLAGEPINYYYFGFVIVGSLIKLLGTVPAIAYNLAVPLLFALTGLGAFSVGYNLAASDRVPSTIWHRPVMAGSVATLFTVLTGNLGVVHLLWHKLIDLGGGAAFPSTIPGFPQVVAGLKGLWQLAIRGASLPMRPETWYWHPTRIIPTAPSEPGPISEFPAFTFLYGDLHAHMIAFPLTLFTLALGVYWVRSSRPRWSSLLMGGLVIGALRPTNTWDYPTYLLLALIALGLGAWRMRRNEETEERVSRFRFHALRFKSFTWRAATLIGLTIVLYLPYARHYVAGYQSFDLWQGSRTPAGIYCWIYGIFLFPLVSWQVYKLASLQVSNLLIVVGGAFVAALALTILGYPVALIVVPVGLLSALLLLVSLSQSRAYNIRHSSFVIRQSPFLWLLAGTAMALSLFVEMVVLKGDVGRMNTVFKIHLQVWMLLAIVGAVSLTDLYSRLTAQTWRVVMILLIAGGVLFLPFGVRARAIDRIAPETGPTLDGMAFMQHASITDGPEGAMEEIALTGDYFALRWMQENISGSPVIIEGLGRREYLWANRVSIYTGLPAVVGWSWHQRQQRAGIDSRIVEQRRSDVNAFYNATDIALAQNILERYNVRYVYVGGYERLYYDPHGLAKFVTMAKRGFLRVAYESHNVTIYEVVE